MENHTSSGRFEFTTQYDMTRVLSSLGRLQTNNFLTGIAVEVQPSYNCSDKSCSVTIRKSTIRRRFGSINLSLALLQTEEGIRVDGFSEIDWLSYWPIAMIEIIAVFGLISGSKDGGMAFIFLSVISAIFLGVAFFEQQNMVEEAKNIL